MKLLREARVRFFGEGLLGDRATFELRYDNMGEPYREGATASIECGSKSMAVFLTTQELKDMHDCLGKLLGGSAAQGT